MCENGQKAKVGNYSIGINEKKKVQRKLWHNNV